MISRWTISARLEWLDTFTDSDHAPVDLEWWGKLTDMCANDERIPKDGDFGASGRLVQ